jgi:hypothetical protein
VPDKAKAVREAIADRVIEHARRGEHDPDRLRDAVLKEIGAGDRLGSPGSRREPRASSLGQHTLHERVPQRTRDCAPDRGL